MTKEEYKNILQITEQKYLELGASRKQHGTDNYAIGQMLDYIFSLLLTKAYYELDRRLNMRTKRVEYEHGSISINEDLEKTIQKRADDFVTDILDGVGSEYLIPDLEPLIMSAVLYAITDKAIIETQESLMEEWEKNTGRINKDEEYETLMIYTSMNITKHGPNRKPKKI